MKDKLYVYYRVSTQDQASKETEKTQKRAIMEFLHGKEVEIVKELYDPAMSGADPDRPAFKYMMSTLDLVDGIVVYDIDRLSRDLQTGINVMFDIKSKGKKLYVARTREIIDFKEGQQELVHMIRSWANAEERVRIKARQIEGMKRYRETHEWGREKKQVNWKRYDYLRSFRISNAAIARMMGISQATLWRRIRERK